MDFLIEDYEDLMDLREAKKSEKDAPTYTLEETKKILGI